MLEARPEYCIHRSDNVWFDKYNSSFSIEDKINPGSLILQQYPESLICNSDPINLIPYELDLTFTPFSDTIITYEI